MPLKWPNLTEPEPKWIGTALEAVAAQLATVETERPQDEFAPERARSAALLLAANELASRALQNLPPHPRGEWDRLVRHAARTRRISNRFAWMAAHERGLAAATETP